MVGLWSDRAAHLMHEKHRLEVHELAGDEEDGPRDEKYLDEALAALDFGFWILVLGFGLWALWDIFLEDF